MRCVTTKHLIQRRIFTNFQLYLELDSLLLRLQACIPQPPFDRAKVLQRLDELKQVYGTVTQMGDCAVPANPEEEVACHNICFVRSNTHSPRHVGPQTARSGYTIHGPTKRQSKL